MKKYSPGCALALLLAGVILFPAAGVAAEALSGSALGPAPAPVVAAQAEIPQPGAFAAGSFEEALRAALSSRGTEMGEFYLSRDYKPFWTEGGKLSPGGAALVSALEESWTHGLNPGLYRVREIAADLEEGRLAGAELRLSEAYVRLGRDLGGIRIDPASLDTRKSYWKQPPQAGTLLRRLSESRDIPALLESLAPHGQTYKRLREELVHLAVQAPPAYEADLPLKITGALNPYQRSAGVPGLRRRLDVPAPEQGDPLVYDEATAAAVIAFQRESGLKVDGIVGGQTLGVLNLTQRQKMDKLIANLERLRWVDEDRPEKMVIVNIPSATLWAIEDNRVAFEMPVVVGRAKRPTNMFIAGITGVRVNPDWTVPPTIKKEDILPKLRENPDYLNSKGMELITLAGGKPRTIDPLAVDWNSLTPAELGKLRMVQIPGAHNPLGRIRVLMPNVYNIYLHDTNQPEYFSRAGRAESSGCVRMSEPEKMAEFILKDRKGWRAEDMGKLYESGVTQDLSISRPIPVHMLYYTVWVAEGGRVVYGNDLYGYDGRLLKQLRGIDGIFIPVNNSGGKS